MASGRTGNTREPPQFPSGRVRQVAGWSLLAIGVLLCVAYVYGRTVTRRRFDVDVIMLPLVGASLLGGGWLVWSGRRARRRAMTGVCGKCGYDLAGLAAGSPCPECGGGDVGAAA
ncbi:MAG: hypothetical protein ACREJO_01770 [Phycisphaerales bacterium]